MPGTPLCRSGIPRLQIREPRLRTTLQTAIESLDHLGPLDHSFLQRGSPKPLGPAPFPHMLSIFGRIPLCKGLVSDSNIWEDHPTLSSPSIPSPNQPLPPGFVWSGVECSCKQILFQPLVPDVPGIIRSSPLSSSDLINRAPSPISSPHLPQP